MALTSQRALQDDAPYDLEFRAIRPEGRLVWIYTHATVMRDQAGSPIRMLGGIVDITERKCSGSNPAPDNFPAQANLLNAYAAAALALFGPGSLTLLGRARYSLRTTICWRALYNRGGADPRRGHGQPRSVRQ